MLSQTAPRTKDTRRCRRRCSSVSSALTYLCTVQRLLLERLTAMAASVLGDQVPVAVVTLETIGLLLEVLGEVAPETTALLQDPLTWKLTSSHSLLRAQVFNLLIYLCSSGLEVALISAGCLQANCLSLHCT